MIVPLSPEPPEVPVLPPQAIVATTAATGIASAFQFNRTIEFPLSGLTRRSLRATWSPALFPAAPRAERGESAPARVAATGVATCYSGAKCVLAAFRSQARHPARLRLLYILGIPPPPPVPERTPP